MAKDYGFNYVRHHSWFPPAEYFDVADELGIMLQPEFPIAYDVFFDGGTAERKTLYLDTWREIIKANWNHPSIIDWCMGNELSGNHALEPEMYRIAKDTDPTRLVIDTDGVWVTTLGDTMRPTLDFLTPVFNEHHLFGLNDNKYPPDLKATKPILVHEMGNFATLPSLSQIPLFKNGVRPFWLYTLRDLVKRSGREKEYPTWVANSNKLQAVALKVNTEAARRSPDISGYQQWLLQDYWNGSNGVLDMFYRPKGSSAAYFRKFNSPTVLLMDTPRRNFWAGEKAAIKLLVSRYEDQAVHNAVLKWELRAGAEILLQGRAQGVGVNSSGVQYVRTVNLTMPKSSSARKLTFAVYLTDKNGKCANDWDLWVYPTDRLKPGAQVICSEGPLAIRNLYPWMKEKDGHRGGCRLLITSRPTASDLGYLESGGRVLLLNPEGVFPTAPSSYRPCWWLGDRDNESKNTGTVIDTAHPALRGMPNEGWCDLNFADLLGGSTAIVLNHLPVRVQPIIRCLDAHAELRDKACLFEVNVGRGRLLVSSMNLAAGLKKKDPASIFLLDRLIRYASGSEFSPSATLSRGFFGGGATRGS
jgi:beta-galactosidase